MKNTNWEKETKVGLVTSCKQAARLVSLSFERKLSLREFLAMRFHLWTCQTCSFYRRQITFLRQAFVRHEQLLDNVPPSSCECLDPGAKARIRGVVDSKIQA